jgi:hypothetical protein
MVNLVCSPSNQARERERKKVKNGETIILYYRVYLEIKPFLFKVLRDWFMITVVCTYKGPH